MGLKLGGMAVVTTEPAPEPDGWTWAETNWMGLLQRLIRYRQRLRFRRRASGVLLRYMQALQARTADRNGVGGRRIDYPGGPDELGRD